MYEKHLRNHLDNLMNIADRTYGMCVSISFMVSFYACSHSETSLQSDAINMQIELLT